MLAEPELAGLSSDLSVAEIASLRRRFDAPVVGAAREGAKARPKAAAKGRAPQPALAHARPHRSKG